MSARPLTLSKLFGTCSFHFFDSHLKRQAMSPRASICYACLPRRACTYFSHGSFGSFLSSHSHHNLLAIKFFAQMDTPPRYEMYTLIQLVFLVEH